MMSAPSRSCVSTHERGVSSRNRCLGENRYDSPESETDASPFCPDSNENTWNPPESETTGPAQFMKECTPPSAFTTEVPGWLARCTVLTSTSSTPCAGSEAAGTPRPTAQRAGGRYPAVGRLRRDVEPLDQRDHLGQRRDRAVGLHLDGPAAVACGGEERYQPVLLDQRFAAGDHDPVHPHRGDPADHVGDGEFGQLHRRVVPCPVPRVRRVARPRRAGPLPAVEIAPAEPHERGPAPEREPLALERRPEDLGDEQRHGRPGRCAHSSAVASVTMPPRTCCVTTTLTPRGSTVRWTSAAISAASASANTGRSRNDHRYSLSDFDSMQRCPGSYSMTTLEWSGCPVIGHTELSSSELNRTRVQCSGAGNHSRWFLGPP